MPAYIWLYLCLMMNCSFYFSMQTEKCLLSWVEFLSLPRYIPCIFLTYGNWHKSSVENNENLLYLVALNNFTQFQTQSNMDIIYFTWILPLIVNVINLGPFSNRNWYMIDFIHNTQIHDLTMKSLWFFIYHFRCTSLASLLPEASQSIIAVTLSELLQ